MRRLLLLLAFARMLAAWAVETGEPIEEITAAGKDEDGQHCAAPYASPGVLKPSHELLGELFAAGRCDEARDAFRKSLLRTPNRRLSMGVPCSAAAPAAARFFTE